MPPPSPFPEYDIPPAFKNQICAIPVNLRRNKEHVSLLKNLFPPRSSSKRPSAIAQTGDKRLPQHLVPGPPSAPAVRSEGGRPCPARPLACGQAKGATLG